MFVLDMVSTRKVFSLPENEKDTDSSVTGPGAAGAFQLSFRPLDFSQISLVLTARHVIGNRRSVIAPYILPCHDYHGMAITKREDFLIIVVVQKHVKTPVSFILANQRIIRRIGNAFDAVELVALQARNSWRCLPATIAFKNRETAAS